MEEAAQILEVESFIPLLLQSPDCDENGPVSRLKRVVLIGDHHQLPPVVQNPAFRDFANMEQSMFTRLVRIGVPTVVLDRQGRSRESIAKLFKWNYPGLGDLVGVNEGLFKSGNSGFKWDYQMIDVGDYGGKGEMEPKAHYLQNLGEAEYVVGVYMWMRLKGYPREKIVILTTYNGQKDLIMDIVEQRCAGNPLFGKVQVSSVDMYQGREKDYVLMSLVKTKGVGHIRDVRRLGVAMSRARLGLYVFCRASVFTNCREIKPVFDLMKERGAGKLILVEGEGYEDEVALERGGKKGKGKSADEVMVEGVEEMGEIVAEETRRKIKWMQGKKDRGEEVVF
jgi:intron-binding protein aquarius